VPDAHSCDVWILYLGTWALVSMAFDASLPGSLAHLNSPRFKVLELDGNSEEIRQGEFAASCTDLNLTTRKPCI
jgi:hypothetical protein